MNLCGRKCSPRPTPPPSWLLRFTILSPAVIPEASALLPALLPTAVLPLLPVPPPSQTYTHMLWMITTPVHHGIFILNLTFFFGPCHVSHEILVPLPGIEPMLPAMEAWSLSH